MSGTARPQLAGRLYRVELADALHLVSPTLADLECEHGVIGACLECDLAPSARSLSPLRTGRWQPDYHSAPATLADLECVHLRIGACAECETAATPTPAQLVLEVG